MDYFGIVLGLIGVMFVAIIGVYIISIKTLQNTNTQLGNIYRTVNQHIQDRTVHPTDVSQLITTNECEKCQQTTIAKHETITAKMAAMAMEITEVKNDVKSLLERLRE